MESHRAVLGGLDYLIRANNEKIAARTAATRRNTGRLQIGMVGDRRKILVEQGMTTRLWTWTGIDFGYREGDELWSHDGRHVGHFHGDVVYAPDGSYLGELRHYDRLISKPTKQTPNPRKAFTRLPDRQPRAVFVGFGGFPMPESYEDFPRPEALR